MTVVTIGQIDTHFLGSLHLETVRGHSLSNVGTGMNAEPRSRSLSRMNWMGGITAKYGTQSHVLSKLTSTAYPDVNKDAYWGAAKAVLG